MSAVFSPAEVLHSMLFHAQAQKANLQLYWALTAENLHAAAACHQLTRLQFP